MFDELADLGDSPVAYLVMTLLVALDAVFPVAPSETLLVTAGVLVSNGDLLLPLAIAAAAAGAVAGDSVLFSLGTRTGPRVRDRLFRGKRSRAALEWAERQLHTRTWLLIVSDFLPGGRTAAMFAAGALGVPAPRFYAFIVPGALLWAAFYVGAGIAGGTVFEDDDLLALAASLGVALALAAIGEGVHQFVLRRRRSQQTR